MGYWKALGMVSAITLAVLAALFAFYWQVNVHPITTVIVVAVAFFCIFVHMMAETWK